MLKPLAVSDSYTTECWQTKLLTISKQARHFRQLRHNIKPSLSGLKNVDSLALANAQLNFQSAYKNFFSQKRVGFPKFKSKKKSRKRYTTNNQNGSVRIENGKLKLPKVGFVKIVQHRQMIGKIKSVTIEKTPTDKYFASILVEYENQVPEVELQKFIGLDFSMHDLYVTSEGERANYPRFLRRSEKKLARLCRRHSKRKLGGQNRERMRLKVCLKYEKITNQRLDFLHKKSYQLSEGYDAVCIETLNMHAMSRTLKFGKSVADDTLLFIRIYSEFICPIYNIKILSCR